MTYRQYYIKLIREITQTEKFIEEKYQELSGSKLFSNNEKWEAYHILQNDLSLLMRKCDKVAYLITSHQVKSTDEVDNDTLGSLLDNIGDV